MTAAREHNTDGYGHKSKTAPPSTRLQARPGKGQVKGFVAAYDPQLDKTLSAAEKKTRRVEYKSFGEQVSLGFSTVGLLI